MLDPASWLHKAEALPEGKSARVGHDCGPGRVMKVDHTQQGWRAYCFRCADSGWVPHPSESLEARLKRLTERYREDERAAASVVPPTPCVFDVDEWPSHAQVWLYKAGFSKPMIQKRGVYYHPPTDRVVLPLVEDGKLVYWQARGFSVDSAKYINPQVDRSKLVAKCGQGDLLVLTEDILSCWKVGEVTEAWSLMGVVLHPSALNRIVQDRRRVAVWLDPDKAGQEGMATIVRTLRLYSVDVTRIDSDKDPKLYTFKEIACHLNLPYCG